MSMYCKSETGANTTRIHHLLLDCKFPNSSHFFMGVHVFHDHLILWNVLYVERSDIHWNATRRVWRYQRELIRIRKSKKNRQHNDQKKKGKRTNNDLQNTIHKTKDRVTRTPLKTEGWGFTPVLRKCSSSWPTSGTDHVYPQLTMKLTMALYIKSLIFFLLLYFE
jgi:hypothetical protein